MCIASLAKLVSLAGYSVDKLTQSIVSPVTAFLANKTKHGRKIAHGVLDQPTDGWYFTGGRVRFPTALGTATAGKEDTIHKTQWISDDFYQNHFYIALGGFYTKTDGSATTETLLGNSFTLAGAAMHAFVGGVWQKVKLITQALNNPIVFASGDIRLIGPFSFPDWIPPETQMSVLLRIQLATNAVIGVGNRNRTGTTELAKASATDADLDSTGSLGGTDGRLGGMIVSPSFMIAKPRDGLDRPVFWGDGDSILWGKNSDENVLVGANYGSMGAVAIALDSKVGKRRYPYAISAIPGVTGAEQSDPTKWAKRRGLIRLCPNRPYTHIITNAMNNISGTYATQFKPTLEAYLKVLKDESKAWGNAEAPIIHTGALPKPGTTDWCTSTGGQGGSSETYPTGARWLAEADMLAGTMAHVDILFKNERVKLDLLNDRDKWKVLGLSTTISTNYVQNSTTLILAANPGIGAMVVVDPGGSVNAARHVTGVTGSGPFTCTLASGINTAGINSGTVVKTTLVGDNGASSGGTHPATPGHVEWALDIAEELAARFG